MDERQESMKHYYYDTINLLYYELILWKSCADKKTVGRNISGFSIFLFLS